MRRILFIIFIGFTAFVSFPLLLRALTVGPGKLEYRTDPGKVISDKFILINEEDAVRTLYPSFEKFNEVNGEKQFMSGEPTELAYWFKMPSSVTLKPKERKEISFTIEVPQNAPPGGHFAVIWWSTAPPGGKGVSIVTRAGMLVYLQVSGDVRESGTLAEFSTINNEYFFSNLPDNFVVKFENTGNTYLKPGGEILLKNIFGSTRLTLGVNNAGLILLPQATNALRITKRVEGLEKTGEEGKLGFFEVAGRQWSDFHLGWYTAELNLAWGATNQTAAAKYSFFIIPWQLLLIIIVILAIIGFLGIIGLEKWDSYIISKAMKQQKK